MMKSVCLVLVCISISVEGAVTITDSNISNSSYTYTLTYDNILTNFGTDVFSTSGYVGVYDFGWGRAVGFSGTGGQLVYRFDFSGTSYRVSSVSFTESLQLYNWGNGDSGTMVTAYSADGSSYTTLSQCATPSTDVIVAQVAGTKVVNFASPVTVVYYTVTETGSNLYQSNNMWARNGFSAAFTVSLTGDINGDGIVNTDDLGELEGLIHYGTTDLAYDLNRDGVVGQADLDYLNHDILHNAVPNNIITLGTDSTYTYKRDISVNKDGLTPVYEAIFDHCSVFSNGARSWVELEGTLETQGVYYKFQAPDGYQIKSAHVVARSFMNNGPDSVTMNAYWAPSFPQYVWDYWSKTNFISRTNVITDWAAVTYTDDVTLNVNSPQLALGFTAIQSDWNGQRDSKGWFVTDDGSAYDPGLVITLTVEPYHYVHKTLENFEGTAADWTMPEANEAYTVGKQNVVKYEGNTALGFHVDNDGEESFWCRTKGILVSAQDWTNYSSITLKVKSSVAGAVGWIGWDFLIIGTEDMYRVNGPGGCGTFVLASNTDWQTVTLDLTPWTRDNVTALEFYITTASCITGSFDLYFDDIQLMTATQATSGDANCDGAVNVSDLSLLAANYGVTRGATWGMGDFTNDGAVNVSDLSLLAANYGAGSSSTLSWADAYAQAFGATSGAEDASDETTDEDAGSTACSSLGLSLIAGLGLAMLSLAGGLRMKE